MVEKTEVMQIKKRGFTKTVYLCNKRGDLNGFQANFETHPSIRKHIRKKRSLHTQDWFCRQTQVK